MFCLRLVTHASFDYFFPGLKERFQLNAVSIVKEGECANDFWMVHLNHGCHRNRAQ